LFGERVPEGRGQQQRRLCHPRFGAWSWEVESGGWHQMIGDCEMGCGGCGAGH